MSTERTLRWPTAGTGPRVTSGRRLTRATALPLALAVWALVALGDYATTAEVGFTLLYLVPIGIAVWWRGLASGLVFAALATSSFVATWIPLATTRPHYGLILAWNLGGEIGVFLVFAFVLHSLRVRLDVEVSARESAVVQLRHADRLNTVGKLASGIAHELGTPLNVVHGRASLLLTDAALDDDARRSATVIVQQAERMTSIIHSLLAFARRGGSRKAPLDLRRLVGETAALLDPLAQKQDARIVIEDGPPCVAPVNASELQQVLSNLVLNSIQAMARGGEVRITVSDGPLPRGARRGKPAASYAQIRVRDQGTGIPPDVLPHIFDPFFTTKDVGRGTGLGLSVTFGIVRDHGGWIDVHTAIGEGTEMIVILPQGEGIDGASSISPLRLSPPGEP